MNKLKLWLLAFVKPLVLAHVQDLGMLAPQLSRVLQNKAFLPQAQSDALAVDLIAVVETELVILINKL